MFKIEWHSVRLHSIDSLSKQLGFAHKNGSIEKELWTKQVPDDWKPKKVRAKKPNHPLSSVDHIRVGFKKTAKRFFESQACLLEFFTVENFGKIPRYYQLEALLKID